MESEQDKDTPELTLEELVEQYVDQEKGYMLDALFEKLSQNGTSEEKQVLADGYLDNFGQCHYDYMCGKFSNPEWISGLMDDLEKVMVLTPTFESYNYYKAHVYEMLSGTNKERQDKVNFLDKCIFHLRKQCSISREDVRLLIDLANNLFYFCQLTDHYPTETMQEIKNLYVEALQLENKKEHRNNFWAFNGSGISGFLTTAYELLSLSIDEKEQLHQDYLTTFKEVIKPHTEQTQENYYHWADALKSIFQWKDYDYKNITPETTSEVWKELKQVLDCITDIKTENEHFLTSVGHLFNYVADQDEHLHYYQVAYRYYKKALRINPKTWSNPYYTSSALRSQAFIYLKNNEPKQAEELFLEGIQIFEETQKELDDFQLSLNHADYLYDYAKIFENFANQTTLLKIEELYEHSRSLAGDHYTQPYYGLIKIALRQKQKARAIDIMDKCGTIFSNEYHTHDFKELVEHEDFAEIQKDIPVIVAKIEQLK